jgi:hypothetical protein
MRALSLGAVRRNDETGTFWGRRTEGSIFPFIKYLRGNLEDRMVLESKITCTFVTLEHFPMARISMSSFGKNPALDPSGGTEAAVSSPVRFSQRIPFLRREPIPGTRIDVRRRMGP